MTKKNYQNWRLEVDKASISWLTFDQKGTQVNTLNQEVIEEFSEIVDYLTEQQKEIKGVVLQSGKTSGFIAGADIQVLTQLTSKEVTFLLTRKVQEIFTKWEMLPLPTVALINGFCLGGGLELALACHYRIAAYDTNTHFALPEVKLGIHPGFGGTVRLVHLIGVFKAMFLMLTGKSIDAKKAQSFGLIDSAVPERVLASSAIYYINKKPYQHQPALWLALIDARIFRTWICRYFYYQLSKKIKKSHYPAPYVIVNRWTKDGALGANAMENEAKSISRLLFTHTSQQLMRVFFLQERLKAFGKQASNKVQHVHVFGAGTMGAGIAAQCILSGIKVSLQDPNKQQLSSAINRIFKEIDLKAKKNFYLNQKLKDAFFPDLEGNELKNADVVIEAIFEDLEAKKNLFKVIEPKLKSDALLATNTSAIPLAKLAEALKEPNRLIGLHFFNPPTKMQLVEVVLEKNTLETEADKGLAFVKQINRLPLPVKSAPGFLVNRLLMPYLMESILMIEEGYLPSSIDKVAENFGMPMGPIALIDKIGLDICLNVGEILAEQYGRKVPEILSQKVKKGKLGCKTQKGFYAYNKQGKIMHKFHFKRYHALPSDTKDRLILSILKEAISCLKEKVVPDAELLDAGLVFGTGFAPFRGGIIQYALSCGIEKEIGILKELEMRYGDRFKVNDNWKKTLREAGVKL